MTSLDALEEEDASSSSVDARLSRIKLQVKKATQEALKYSGSSGNTAASSNNNAAADPNASFHLGMDLFGQDVSALERNVQEQLRRIETELESVMTEIQRGGSGVAFEQQQQPQQEEHHHQHKQSPQEIAMESQQLRTKLAFLKECSAAREALDESITLSTPALAPNEEADLVQAAQLTVKSEQALKRAEEILEQQAESNNKSPVLAAAYTIVDSIRSEMRRQKVDLIGKATSLWHACVSFTNNHNALAVSTAKGLSVSYDILEALNETHTLEATLRQFSRTLHQQVFQPALDAHLAGKVKPACTFHEVEDRAGSSSSSRSGTSMHSSVSSLTKGPVRRLEWTNTDDDAVTEEIAEDAVVQSWGETLAFIQRIVVFVADHILLQRPSLCDFAALRLFGKPNALPNALNLEALGLESCRLGDDDGLLLLPLANAMEETCIPRYLKPNELDQLHARARELEGYLEPFLEAIAAKNMLPLDGKTRLSTFTSSFGQKYVEWRRCALLNEARDMCVNNDYHNTVQVGEDVRQNKDEGALGMDDGMAVFKLPKMCVSDTAGQLMAMCRRIMDEAVEQQVAPELSPLSTLPATLYRTAREVLDLFRAIIPVTHGHEVAQVPRTAAVLHNDGVFLAYHCLTLGLEYKDKFPEVPAEDVRGQLLRQTCMFVDMVPLFRDLADRSLGDMLDAQAKQLSVLVGERIPLLGEALRSDEILAEWSEAETGLQAGLYHLRHLSQAWKPILSYDIWNRSMCFLVDVMFTLVLDQVARATDISANAAQFTNALFQKATHDLDALLEGDKSGSRAWDRFMAVGRVMDMSIADIQVALSDGMFRSVTGPELVHLVQSCFDDGPKRRALLQTLSSNH